MNQLETMELDVSEADDTINKIEHAGKLIEAGVPDELKDGVIESLFSLAKEASLAYIDLARSHIKLLKLVEALVAEGNSSDEYETRSVN
jgi:hypothetical protein